MFKFNLKKFLAGTGIPVCAIYVGNSADLLLLLLRWYHGRLDRFQSEERLRLAEQHGSYLVRESDRQDAHTHNLGSILATRPNNQCCRAATIFGGSGPGSARSGSRRRLRPDGVSSGQKGCSRRLQAAPASLQTLKFFSLISLILAGLIVWMKSE